MKKYKVIYLIEYELTASSKDKALEKAFDKLTTEINSINYTDLDGANVTVEE